MKSVKKLTKTRSEKRCHTLPLTSIIYWNGTQIIFFLCIVLYLGICGRQNDKVIKIDEVYKLRNL